ncbi:MAG: hypothetical protein PHF79_02365, partial [Candidatus Pacebacteria bacterium]|nr:hypothetical protein [Candidatus Paceibacterota bacterium]
FSIGSIVLKRLLLSSNGENSQYAFYAADSAGECALYWDRNATTTSTGSAFATSSTSVAGQDFLPTINCNNTPVTTWVTGSDATFADTVFYVPLSPTTCGFVTVHRTSAVTTVDARGYNAPFSQALNGNKGGCDTTNPRAVERGLLITF